MCLYPKLMRNKRYVPNEKNGGNVPLMRDNRIGSVPIGCGECMECRKKKAFEWQVRLSEEMRSQKLRGYFVTWTFSEESLNDLKHVVKNEGCDYEGWKLENEVARVSVRRYLERWRKKHGRSLRHWIVTEKGQTNTERIHMHGLVWTDKDKDDILERWGYGHCDIGKKGVNEASAGYLVKYMSKVDEKHRDYKSKVFSSPGIGSGYLIRKDSEVAKRTERYVNRKGQKFSLPMYYRLKLWTDEEREDLWMMKLDEGRRFVLGEEVDISNEAGMRDYEALLKQAQNKNKRYGFGEGKTDWDKKRYIRTLNKLKDGSYRRHEKK